MPRLFHIISIVGARPNFMKVAPIGEELALESTSFRSTIVHTGQHYDSTMSDVFFDQLDVADPDVNLNVGSASHAQQTAAIMSAFEPVLLEWQPDLVLVVGDVNSTLACALVAAKLGVKVAHVEAGLRSFDRSMPEEINRVVTDQISDILFVTERGAEQNLRREGIASEKIYFVGNVLIDTLLSKLERARALHRREIEPDGDSGYAVLTLHRPSNVDDRRVFERLMSAVAEIGKELPVVFPVHPRTRLAVEASPTAAQLLPGGRLELVKPLGYLQFLGLMDRSHLVLTDSGGIQEETTVLGIPCLTLRDTTERPITVSEGTNQIVGSHPERILEGWRRVKTAARAPRTPELWDGKAAHRIVQILRSFSEAHGPGSQNP